MKKIFYTVLTLAGLLSACTPVIYTSVSTQPAYPNQPQATYADQPQTDQVFYDALAPYGQWIEYPDYGYVWQPNVDQDFRPYVTNGSWVYTDQGWTWASDYDWGWAPFHYGRWFMDDTYGWLWSPGEQWAPAWVTWGQSGDYYGWAPVPPHVDFNSGWQPRTNDWNFVAANNINRGHIDNYTVRNNITVVRNTYIINNINTNITNRNTKTVIYNRGPNVHDVEHAANIQIQEYRVAGGSRPGQSIANNQLTIYRPAINPNAAAGNLRPMPQGAVKYRPNNNQPAGQQNPGFGHDPNQQRQSGGQLSAPNGSAQQDQRQPNGHGGNQNPQQNQQYQRQPNGQVTDQNQQNQRQPNGQGGNQNPQQSQQNPRQPNGQVTDPNTQRNQQYQRQQGGPTTITNPQQNQQYQQHDGQATNPNGQQNQQYQRQSNGKVTNPNAQQPQNPQNQRPGLPAITQPEYPAYQRPVNNTPVSPAQQQNQRPSNPPDNQAQRAAQQNQRPPLIDQRPAQQQNQFQRVNRPNAAPGSPNAPDQAKQKPVPPPPPPPQQKPVAGN